MRFLNTKQKLLIEEKVEDEDLFIARSMQQAPEVDGLTVVEGINAKPGEFITAQIKKVNEKDFYAVELSE